MRVRDRDGLIMREKQNTHDGAPVRSTYIEHRQLSGPMASERRASIPQGKQLTKPAMFWVIQLGQPLQSCDLATFCLGGFFFFFSVSFP